MTLTFVAYVAVATVVTLGVVVFRIANARCKSCGWPIVASDCTAEKCERMEGER